MLGALGKREREDGSIGRLAAELIAPIRRKAARITATAAMIGIGAAALVFWVSRTF